VNILQLFFLLADGKRAKRGRVKGGSKVRDTTKYPSFVSIVTRNGAHYCGGVILDEMTVLSSAHCQIEKGHKVAYGTIKRSDRIESSIKYADIRSVNDIGRMNSRGKSLWDEDYSIVRLASPLRFDSKTKSAVLGTFDEFANFILTGKTTCMIVGNGRTENPNYSDTLKEGRTKIHAYKTQAVKWLTGDDTNVFLMDNSGNAKADKGDSGGPLYCTVNGQQKVFGVASFAHNGGVNDYDAYSGYAAVFTPAIQKHLSRWNQRNKTPRNFETMDIMIRNYRANGEILTSSSTKAKTGGLKAPSNRFGGGKQLSKFAQEYEKKQRERHKTLSEKRRLRRLNRVKQFNSYSNTSPKTTKRPPTQYTTRTFKRNQYQNSFSKYSNKPRTTYKPPTQQTPRYNSHTNYGRQNEQDCSCD